MKLKINHSECKGECIVEYKEDDYIEPAYCPFCGKELYSNEVEVNNKLNEQKARINLQVC